ncbi:hypothetical protein AOLI_G00141800 [Acnodon oligacanthus]
MSLPIPRIIHNKPAPPLSPKHPPHRPSTIPQTIHNSLAPPLSPKIHNSLNLPLYPNPSTTTQPHRYPIHQWFSNLEDHCHVQYSAGLNEVMSLNIVSLDNPSFFRHVSGAKVKRGLKQDLVTIRFCPNSHSTSCPIQLWWSAFVLLSPHADTAGVYIHRTAASTKPASKPTTVHLRRSSVLSLHLTHITS